MSDDLKPDQPQRPGDEVPPGTTSAGENVCPECEGSGRKDGAECPACQGSGRVIEPIGGG